MLESGGNRQKEFYEIHQSELNKKGQTNIMKHRPDTLHQIGVLVLEKGSCFNKMARIVESKLNYSSVIPLTPFNSLLFSFPVKCPDKVKRIPAQYNDDQHKVEHQFCLRVQVPLCGKHLERIVCRVEENARDQRFPVVED